VAIVLPKGSPACGCCRCQWPALMPVSWSSRDRSRSPRSKNYEEIVQTVVMREQARQAKDWALADTYRTQLQQMGVTLFDKTNSWRSNDGLSGRIPSWADLEAGETPEAISNQMLQMLPSSSGEGTSSIDEAKVKDLVKQREEARSNKDFNRSDEIREELKAIGVEVYDKEKIWRAKCGASGCILGFRGANGPTDLEITTLVVQREKARQSGDWASSDMIRDELKAVGVEIFDKDKMWKASDGRQAPVPSWAQIQSGATVVGPVSKLGAGGLSQQQLQALLMPLANSGEGGGVQSQVLAAAIMAAQNPATAARTLQMLQSGVGRDQPKDAEQTEKVEEAMQFIDDCKATGRDATDAEINWLVGIREKCRQNKDFSSADEMRAALANHLGVQLMEKEKKWETNDGRYGSIPMWTNISV